VAAQPGCQVGERINSRVTLVFYRKRAASEQSGAKQKVGARVRKSRQKEAAGAADAGVMQIEWSEGEVLKLAGVGTEEEEEAGEGVGAGIDGGTRCERGGGVGVGVRSRADRGGARQTVQSLRVVGEQFHAAVVIHSGGARSGI
jgi:hypothetical protein